MRTLSLKRETLTELTDEQLGLVAGAALPTTPVGPCLGGLFTHHSAVDCVTTLLCKGYGGTF